MRALVCLLILSAAAAAAPVPRPDAPDPLGKGYMGIRASNGVSTSDQGSLVINQIYPNTPASDAGLRTGDVICSLGPLRPQNFDEVRVMIGCLRPGTRIRIVVKRGGTEITAVLILATRPENFGTIELVDPQP